MRMESFRACAIVLSAIEADNDWVIMAHCPVALTQPVGLERWGWEGELEVCKSGLLGRVT